MKFQDRTSFTPDDLHDAINRNAPDEIFLVPLTAALLATDVAAAQEACITLAVHANPIVRGNALLGFGHLARRFRCLDERRVKPLLEAGLRDADDNVRILAKSASDEVCQFLHWTIAGHIYG